MWGKPGTHFWAGTEGRKPFRAAYCRQVWKGWSPLYSWRRKGDRPLKSPRGHQWEPKRTPVIHVAPQEGKRRAEECRDKWGSTLHKKELETWSPGKTQGILAVFLSSSCEQQEDEQSPHYPQWLSPTNAKNLQKPFPQSINRTRKN